MQKWLLWSLSFCILDADCLTTSWRHSDQPASASRRFKNARNLIVVLPVIHGYDNISQEKLQYLYTKPPVTVVVEDATHSPQQAASLRARPNVVFEKTPTRTYETMRKPSSRRPLPPPPSMNHLEPIDSDTRYLDFLDTLTLPEEYRAKTDRKEYEYPISSYDFVVSTSRPPTVEYPKSTVDSNWKAIYVNYTDSSLPDSTDENLADELSNSTEAADKIISILAELGYLSSIDTSGAETDGEAKSTESNYLSSFKTFATKQPSSANGNAHSLLHSLGLLGQKRPNADNSSSLARQKRQAGDDSAEPEPSTTTESARSRVLRYMMANPRIKSVHELFQVIRSTMRGQSPTSTQRMGKSSKDDNVLVPRQGFDRGADAASANTTDAAVAATSDTNGTMATSLNDVDAPSPSEVASSTPPNGVYFYVDWNSFLNMTPASGDPISVNFSPKAGNRRFFTPIDAFDRLAGST